MFKPRTITHIEDCITPAWQIQSWGYPTALDAKMAAAKVYTVKQGAMVKPHAGQWAVFYWSNRVSQ
jgi:hypothetical protein